MKGKSAHAVAAQEAYEEAGVEGECRRNPIGSYMYRKRLEHGLSIVQGTDPSASGCSIA